MSPLFTKKVVGAIFIIAIAGVGWFVFGILQSDDVPEPVALESKRDVGSQRTVIGVSVEGREIEAYTWGNGETHLAFIGGMHGGYEWNTVLLAYTFVDYLEANAEIIPDNLSITVIPSANPDGVYKVINKEGRFVAADIASNTVPGRFNANEVDLNRNFDCKWKPESMWRDNIVSAGSSPFSEPEAMALRGFVLENDLTAAIFWHSQANTVYASECEDGILEETIDIMNVYAQAAEYQAVEFFDQYEFSGDAEGWLASIGIPAITVELQTHEAIDWERNLAGIKALFEYYSNEK